MKSRERLLDETIERQKLAILKLTVQKEAYEALLNVIYQSIKVLLKGGEDAEADEVSA